MSDGDAIFLMIGSILIVGMLFGIALDACCLLVRRRLGKRYKPEKHIRRYFIKDSVKNILDPCKNCGSNDIFIECSLEFPTIHAFNPNLKRNGIWFPEHDTKMMFSVRCDGCGVRTDDEKDLIIVLNKWNGYTKKIEGVRFT